MGLESEQGHDTDWFRAGTEIRAQEYVLGVLQGQKVDWFGEGPRRCAQDHLQAASSSACPSLVQRGDRYVGSG